MFSNSLSIDTNHAGHSSERNGGDSSDNSTGYGSSTIDHQASSLNTSSNCTSPDKSNYNNHHDDVWGSDNDNDREVDNEHSMAVMDQRGHGTIQRYDQAMSDREWTRLERLHHNDGYREGLEMGKERTLQRGFDQGYQEGLALGKEIGLLRGKLASIITAYQLGHSMPVNVDDKLMQRAIDFEKRCSPAQLATSLSGWMSIGTVEEVTTSCNNASKEHCACASTKTASITETNTSTGCCRSNQSNQQESAFTSDPIELFRHSADQLRKDGFPL
ncbi:hypothetical protein BDF19DRAFT_445826 [Syncephalis fuscata]|nr:hypothetical protein BDF19DRAFT_445826 [Syncephalis fuscata]